MDKQLAPAGNLAGGMAGNSASAAACPRCLANQVVAGTLIAESSVGEFQPNQPKWLKQRIPLPSAFLACPQCGLLWTEVDAKALTAIVQPRKF